MDLFWGWECQHGWGHHLRVPYVLRLRVELELVQQQVWAMWPMNLDFSLKHQVRNNQFKYKGCTKFWCDRFGIDVPQHPMSFEVNTRSCKFVESLIGEKHLA